MHTIRMHKSLPSDEFWQIIQQYNLHFYKYRTLPSPPKVFSHPVTTLSLFSFVHHGLILPVLKLVSGFIEYSFIKLFYSLSVIFLRFISVAFSSSSFHFIILGLFLRLKCILGRNYLLLPEFLRHTVLNSKEVLITLHITHLSPLLTT